MFVVALLLEGCGGGARASEPTTVGKPAGVSLYDRLGGMDVIDAIVKDFVEVRIAQDDRIRDRFKTTDLLHFEKLLAAQICEASGGPCKYTGKNMREMHAGMAITEAEFGALVEDLVASLNKFNVPKAEQDELIGKLATMHDDIVGR